MVHWWHSIALIKTGDSRISTLPSYNWLYQFNHLMYWRSFLSFGLNTEYWIGCGGEESFRSLEGYFDVYFTRTSQASPYIIPYLSNMDNVSQTIWKWTHQPCKKSSALYLHNSCVMLFYQCIFIYSCHRCVKHCFRERRTAYTSLFYIWGILTFSHNYIQAIPVTCTIDSEGSLMSCTCKWTPS